MEFQNWLKKDGKERAWHDGDVGRAICLGNSSSGKCNAGIQLGREDKEGTRFPCPGHTPDRLNQDLGVWSFGIRGVESSDSDFNVEPRLRPCG